MLHYLLLFGRQLLCLLKTERFELASGLNLSFSFAKSLVQLLEMFQNIFGVDLLAWIMPWIGFEAAGIHAS